MSLPGLAEACAAYETALMANDLETLDRLFAPGEQTLRGDAAGLLVGHERIRAFRAGRGGAPARRIVATHVQVVDDAHALVVCVTELLTGGRGQQTQLWASDASGTWRITAAHVSTAPTAFDPRIWRVVGDPLVPAESTGRLDGQTVAVKDLFAVAGHPIGAGNPARLAAATPEPVHAWAVDRLLRAGAAVRGIARTDEFAYGLAGANAHYGTPPNPQAPFRLPGGSSSGSASAVSLGHATIGLGTDTAGSIRVPAAYQGLWGIRPTHGAVRADGVLPLSVSFDTVGWLTREPALLAAVADVLLPPDTAAAGALVVAPALVARADDEVAAAVRGHAAGHDELDWPADLDPARLLPVFRLLQAYEAWHADGDWLTGRLDTLASDVRQRFEDASTITEAAADGARDEIARLRHRIRDVLGDRVLVLPSASSVAPPVDDPAARDAVRRTTMELTCLAGIAGLPAVSVPVSTAAGLPAGVCLVGPAGSDRSLIDLARRCPGPRLAPGRA